MDKKIPLTFHRLAPRQRKTALLYVMRPDSDPEHPVWDLVRVFSYFGNQGFDLSREDGLYYMVMSPSGEILADTLRNLGEVKQ